MRGLALGGDLSQVSSVRECSRIPWKRKTLADTADPPRAQTAWAPSRSLPRCCSLPVACMELLAARRCWVRPALSEKIAFSSCLRKGLRAYAPRGASPGRSPRAHAPERLLRAAFALSRLPRPAPPRSEFEEGSRGAELCRPAAVRSLVGEVGLWWRVVGKDRAHARVRGTPSPRGALRDGGVLEGRRWAPGPTRLPVSPVPSVACVPPTRVHVLATLAARACRAWCVPRALGRVRLPPRPTPFLGGVPTAGGIAGALLPPSTGLWRVRVSRGWPRSRGRTLFGGTAVGRVRRVVGRRDPLPLVGLRRWATVSASVFSRAGSAAPWASGRCPLVSGRRLGAAGVVGLLPGSGVQCDSRRFASRARSPPERSLPVPL